MKQKTQFIILRGIENRGKTTLCAEIYGQLLQYADKEHLFGKPWEYMTNAIQNSIKLDDSGNVCDFQALLSIGNKKIAFFSMGDYVPDYFKIKIDGYININVDILVCCTRSRNRENSTFRYIEEKYADFHKITFWTEYAQNINEKHNVKQTQAKEIVQYILNELK